MDSTVTPTPPKAPQDFTVAHFLDRIGRMSLHSSQISLGRGSTRWLVQLSVR